MAFLRKKSENGHVLSEVYSGFQKAMRRGLVPDSMYYARQIRSVSSNALKKRICLNILEDICSIKLCMEVYSGDENDSDQMELLLMKGLLFKKTHVSAWLNRYAVDCLLVKNNVIDMNIGKLVQEGKELEAAIRGMYFRAADRNKEIFEELECVLPSLNLSIESAWKIFRYCNDSPLVWLNIILSVTRQEIRENGRDVTQAMCRAGLESAQSS